jgi:hypothetical protein
VDTGHPAVVTALVDHSQRVAARSAEEVALVGIGPGRSHQGIVTTLSSAPGDEPHAYPIEVARFESEEIGLLRQALAYTG